MTANVKAKPVTFLHQKEMAVVSVATWASVLHQIVTFFSTRFLYYTFI